MTGNTNASFFSFTLSNVWEMLQPNQSRHLFSSQSSTAPACAPHAQLRLSFSGAFRHKTGPSVPDSSWFKRPSSVYARAPQTLSLSHPPPPSHPVSPTSTSRSPKPGPGLQDGTGAPHGRRRARWAEGGGPGGRALTSDQRLSPAARAVLWEKRSLRDNEAYSWPRGTRSALDPPLRSRDHARLAAAVAALTR